MRFLSTILRPAFGLFLFLAQFTATRETLFTANVVLLGLGILLILAGLWLWGSASRHLQHALKLPPKIGPHAKWKWCTILTKHVEENNGQASHIYG